MSEANGVAASRYRSRVKAARLAAEFEQSGMTRKAFCARLGLSVATLDNYRKRHRSSTPLADSRILPVEWMPSTAQASNSMAVDRGGLWVELANGRRIEVASGFDATTLERLLVVLDTPTIKDRLPGVPFLEKA